MAGNIKRELSSIELNNLTTGERIAFFRKKKGLTQKELAELLEIKRTLLTDYEIGRVRIYDDMLVRIAEVLKISTDKILGIDKTIDFDSSPSLKIIKRVKEIEKLPPNQQKIILRNIDINLAGLSKEAN